MSEYLCKHDEAYGEYCADCKIDRLEDVVEAWAMVAAAAGIGVEDFECKCNPPSDSDKIIINLRDALAKLKGREKSYLDERLEDPEFRKHYEEQSRLIDEEETSQD